jgi:hypothetical protein
LDFASISSVIASRVAPLALVADAAAAASAASAAASDAVARRCAAAAAEAAAAASAGVSVSTMHPEQAKRTSHARSAHV